MRIDLEDPRRTSDAQAFGQEIRENLKFSGSCSQ
jgi:hypothetical protein